MQANESDTEIPEDFKPTFVEIEKINQVDLDKNFLISLKEAKEEREEPLSLVTWISNLEETQG